MTTSDGTGNSNRNSGDAGMAPDGGGATAPGAQADLHAELAQARAQLAAQAAAQEEFLRAVSHDLRAPLRHVLSYGALVREVLQGDLPAEAAQSAPVREALGFLATMDQSARRMGQMVDGLLAISRAQRAPLRPQAVPLADALARARAALAGAEAQAGRTVAWLLPPAQALPTLRADPDQLHELLVQLLGNALKFTRPAAQPSITVAAGAADALGRVEVRVVDNGAGFDPARAAGLFGVFQRLHRETEFEGVGAGLALCRAVAERHGATVAATGVPGGGCTVSLLWPVA